MRRIPLDPLVHPTLCGLLNANDVQYCDGEYIGTASDGVSVTFGMDGDESAIESYLSSHPSPSEW